MARARVGNDAAGFTQLLRLPVEAGDSAAHPIPLGIETDRGLWVAALRETGRVIYPINPLAASRYRARYAASGAKSYATDAVLLVNIIRTDPGVHRPLPADTELAQAIRVLARAQQDAGWARQQVGNQIRDLLKDFYPAKPPTPPRPRYRTAAGRLHRHLPAPATRRGEHDGHPAGRAAAPVRRRRPSPPPFPLVA